jgi:hypothetical protein
LLVVVAATLTTSSTTLSSLTTLAPLAALTSLTMGCSPKDLLVMGVGLEMWELLLLLLGDLILHRGEIKPVCPAPCLRGLKEQLRTETGEPPILLWLDIPVRVLGNEVVGRRRDLQDKDERAVWKLVRPVDIDAAPGGSRRESAK